MPDIELATKAWVIAQITGSGGVIVAPNDNFYTNAFFDHGDGFASQGNLIESDIAGDYALGPGDRLPTVFRFTNTTPATFTLPEFGTVPLPEGTWGLVIPVAAGTVTIVPEGGALVNGSGGGSTVCNPNTVTMFLKTNADEWWTK